MPFLLTSYDTGNNNQDAANASKLSERFGKLARATGGEMKVHTTEAANSFIIEYNSKDKNRPNDRLKSTIESLISTYSAGNEDGLAVESINTIPKAPRF